MNRTSIVLPYYNRKEYLKPALDGFQHFYGDDPTYNFEIVIVDDCSSAKHILNEEFLESYSFDINYIRLSEKRGQTPAYPINVGVRKSKGEIIILSSPEIVHTNKVLDYNLNDISLYDYWCFSVFCPTEIEFTKLILSDMPFNEKLAAFREKAPLMYKDFTNSFFSTTWGSWYLHSKYRPSNLNFCVAFSKKRFEQICGFDERFVGTGYDDIEFIDRMLPDMNIKYFDDFEAIHINHPPVYGSGDPITNHKLYFDIANGKIPRWKNEDWGEV